MHSTSQVVRDLDGDYKAIKREVGILKSDREYLQTFFDVSTYMMQDVRGKYWYQKKMF